MSTRLSAGDRLARLLSVIPWVTENPGSAIDDIVQRFGYPRHLLLGDLQNVVFFVGVHPFTPDQLIEVTISDDKVWIQYADWFARPLRLTSQEAAELLATARAALVLAGDHDSSGTLVRALTKLGAMLGGDGEQILDVRLGEARVEIFEVIRDAIESGACIEIDYYSYGRDRSTRREVDPIRLFSDNGHWYLDGWCNNADDYRMFRVDRIETARTTDTEARHGASRTVPSFVSGDDDPRIEILLDKSAEWVVEQYPCERLSKADDGRTRVRLAITEVPWLQRLLLRLGPAAEVFDQDDALPSDLVASAARRVLARYDA